MELYVVEALSLSLLFLLIIPLSINDLSSTKVALLNFVAVVPQGQKVTWRSKTPVCTSWAGVSCYGKRVTMLCLSGIGVPVKLYKNLSLLVLIPLFGVNQMAGLELRRVETNIFPPHNEAHYAL
nr:probable inactive receptor kinase At5g58300 [Tanacetum cinerariifolium]